jgi:4-hydroxybenzoyl-CoA reductase subunit beta
MDAFELVVATSYAEALSFWTPDSLYIAGGTDLLPNLKHKLFQPKKVISLAGIQGGVRQEGQELRIGAGTTLSQLARNSLVQKHLPMLAEAAALVAGPQIRNAGTLGGNILLDTRCLYYNQTEFWRQSLGYCLKAEGSWCHVVGGPKTCVAAQSSDTVPVLLAAGAVLELLGPSGSRVLPIRDLYRFNGMDHLKLEKGELLTGVQVPIRPWRGSYQKLRTRASIDFPQLGLAILAEFSEERLQALELVVGAINPQPKGIKGLEAFLGKPLDSAAIDAIGALVYQQVRPQGSVHGEPGWRRQMAVVLTKRGLKGLKGQS